MRAVASRGVGAAGTLGFVAAMVLLALGPRAAAQGGGEPVWAADTFCFPGIDGGTSVLADYVWDACVYDDGTGPALYITGDFTIAGCARATNIAKWDGRRWSALEGPDGEGVSNGRGGEGGRTLAVFDDGTGPALYVGGVFLTAGGRPASNVARWDGSDWSALEGPDGQGVARESPTIAVRDMVVYDDGTGPALYVGGTFQEAGGRTATRIARWDGTDWSPLAGPMGEGISGSSEKVRALAVFDDGSGPDLYVTGSFDTAGGRDINRVARWDGTDWSDVGDWQGDGQGLALQVYDNGTGQALYMGGAFDVDGAFIDLARWTGSAWEDPGIRTDREIACFEVIDDGGVRPALYVGGNFDDFDGRDYDGLARYDGEQWTEVGGGVEPGLGGSVRALRAFDDGSGPGLFVGGHFHEASGKQLHSITRWDFHEYRLLGNAPLDPVFAMAAFDNGAGEALYIGGDFLSVGDVQARRVARFDGESFSPVGNGLGSFVDELLPFDDGTGRQLLALAGTLWRFDAPSGMWNEWIRAAGIDAVAAHDDGSGPSLFIGGRFGEVRVVGEPAQSIDHLARWDGIELTAVDWPYPDGPANIASVRVGDRTELYVAGFYRDAMDKFLYYITRWDGAAWEPIVGPIQGGGYHTMAGFDDGSGWALYATGDFEHILGPTASRLARWDGTSWTDVGQSLGDGAVFDLLVHDDGSGPALYATGSFPGDGVALSRIAKWDGLAWSPLADDGGQGLDDDGRVMASVDEGTGPTLYVAGDFRTAGGVGSAGLAKWAAEAVPCRADIDGDGELTIFDFLAFQNAFDAGDLAADFDGDGELTIFDFLAFQNEFDARCA